MSFYALAVFSAFVLAAAQDLELRKSLFSLPPNLLPSFFFFDLLSYEDHFRERTLLIGLGFDFVDWERRSENRQDNRFVLSDRNECRSFKCVDEVRAFTDFFFCFLFNLNVLLCTYFRRLT